MFLICDTIYIVTHLFGECVYLWQINDWKRW